MPLPTSGLIPLVNPNSEQQPDPAYLIKFPEEVWSSIQEAATGGLEVTMTVDGRMTLNIPNLPPIPLDPRSTGIPSELHSYDPSSSSLSLKAIATTRLNVPLTSALTAKAADKLKAQNEAIERERKERAVRVEGSAPPSKKRHVERLAPGIGSSGMGRTNSSPQMTNTAALSSGSTAPGTGTNGSGQTIALKTRVMQLLALGPTTITDILRRVGGDEHHVTNTVNVVGRASSTRPVTYTLLPNQYSKIKLGPGQWKYTYAEQQQVIRLAKEAFDELDLPFDAEEREELSRKEAELEGGYHSAGGSSSTSSQEKSLSVSSTVPQNGLHIAPPTSITNTQKRTVSPAPITSSSTVTSGSTSTTRTKSSNGTSASGSKKTGPQSKIAREKAKFMLEKQRSTSLPNTKQIDGTASPRSTPMEIKTSATKQKEKVDVKGKEEKMNGKIKEKEKGKSKEIDYSSDDEEEEEEPLRGRSVNKVNGNSKEKNDKKDDRPKVQQRPSLADKVRERDKAREKAKELSESSISGSPRIKKRSYSSSDSDGGGEEGEVMEEEGEARGRPISKIRRNSSPTSNSFNKRKQPPPELNLAASSSNSLKASTGANQPVSAPLPNTNLKNVFPSSSTTSTTASDLKPSSASLVSTRSTEKRGPSPSPDQESLRDRYEELYPAYQQLTKKLSRIHQAAESGLKVDESPELNQGELSKLVKKWEKWHKELENIRRWFV